MAEAANPTQPSRIAAFAGAVSAKATAAKNSIVNLTNDTNTKVVLWFRNPLNERNRSAAEEFLVNTAAVLIVIAAVVLPIIGWGALYLAAKEYTRQVADFKQKNIGISTAAQAHQACAATITGLNNDKTALTDANNKLTQANGLLATEVTTARGHNQDWQMTHNNLQMQLGGLQGNYSRLEAANNLLKRQNAALAANFAAVNDAMNLGQQREKALRTAISAELNGRDKATRINTVLNDAKHHQPALPNITAVPTA